MKYNRKNTFLGILFFVLGLYIPSYAQPISPFNKLQIKDTAMNYSFIVSGHFYGASSNASTFPASSLLANIEQLNTYQVSFLMSLGDMFMDVDDNYLNHYQKSLFNKLKIPLFNAVGNHDVSNGNRYEKEFGNTFFSFKMGTELFIILNTEINDGSIKDGQLEVLKTALKPEAMLSVKNIFIFSHRPIWAEQLKEYKGLFSGNTRSAFGNNNFTKDVLPLLQAVSKQKNICWLSGSMAGGPSSFFYDKHKETNITFMQTAIRDQPHDAALLVTIENGQVKYSGISFTGQTLKKIESYNIKYWLGTPAPESKFNYRLLPYLTIQLISHVDFWIGFSLSTLLIITFLFIRKRIRDKKMVT